LKSLSCRHATLSVRTSCDYREQDSSEQRDCVLHRKQQIPQRASLKSSLKLSGGIKERIAKRARTGRKLLSQYQQSLQSGRVMMNRRVSIEIEHCYLPLMHFFRTFRS
jgi:hypothetical protein